MANRPGFKIDICGECVYCCARGHDHSVRLDCRLHPPTATNPDVSFYPGVRRDTPACAQGKGAPKPRKKPTKKS